ncbi:MAG: thioesterase family protein [Planctomycetia bacterium]|nr:thioesterase family protein [Planctomycetia bacterium]
MSAQFTSTQRVGFADTDMAGIIHFANYYRYMEDAEHAFFRSLGLSIMQKQPGGAVIGWPRVSASCSFEAPAYFEDELEVRLSVIRKGVKSLTFEIEFWRGETRLAHGRLKTVCCLCRAHEPLVSIAIPAEYSDKIQEVPQA